MASVPFHIANLLEKMTSSDKDFRFMATNDLMVELQKDSIKLDDESERKVVRMLLRLLEDKNGEVQNLAVKCLGPLVKKVKEFQVETIVETLCCNMLSDKEQLRDISSIGLKTVISELPPSSTALAASICKKITGKLTSAISKQEDVSVQLEALDILGDLLSRFGGLLVTFHSSIQQALLPQLSSPRLAVRKRSIIATGHLVLSSNAALFTELMDFLLSELDRNTSTSTTRTYIQCIGAISRQAGHRVGEHLERIIPLIVKFCRVDDDELREYCIQAFESFVRRCPKEISPHIDRIIQLCLEYIAYDPNYNYEEGADEDDMELEDDDDDNDSDDEYSDDDDMSWKVRRASAKCIDAIIATRHAMLDEFYANVSPALISRFKEREENVKADIFHAYITLLKQTKPTISQDPDAMDSEDGPVGQLQVQIPAIVQAVHKQLREKSIKTRQCCFLLLTELVQVLPGSLNQHITAIVPGIIFSLGEKNSSSNMKIDTLSFVNCLLGTHNPIVFHPHVSVIVPPVVIAVQDPFYKITSEALLVAQQIVKVIRPIGAPANPAFASFVLDLYRCTLHRLKAADIDQEVKERAISCMGQIICNHGDMLGAELNTCLPIFLERLKNEITRLTTVKALTMIAGVKAFLSWLPILPQLLSLICSPLMQGVALSALLDFFQALVVTNTNGVRFRDLLQMLTQPVYSAQAGMGNLAVHKHAFLSIAQSIAALTIQCKQEAVAVVNQFIADIKNPKSSDSVQLLSLLTLGEIGKHIDLSSHGSIQNVILESFSSPNEEVKSAASYALGNVSVGNLLRFLPFVLQEIEKQPRRQYLLLHSLKEIISCQSMNDLAVESLKPYVSSIWSMLMSHCECAEEGTRNVVAECLGKLTLINAVELLPKLKSYLSSPTALTRSTVITAVKFTISDQPQAVDPLLRQSMGHFLEALHDQDLNVRRVALVAFNSAAHNKPSLIRDLLQTTLTHLYSETKVRKELIREVEMGPFKHTVDDGLDIRKAAFECMYTLLDSCLDRIDIFDFLRHVEDGLHDHYDIKMLTYLMLVRLAHLSPNAVLQRFEFIIEPLRQTCTTKVKANSVKQEFEKQDELKRSAMRAVAALLHIPDADKSPPMNDFLSQIKSNPDLCAMFEGIQKDAATVTASETALMDMS
ncbi:hypothetical protein CAPTEDRAFT_19001 [Capitella teleta]|uniref:TATA-binding protein interacting (TIP20) domain-containing protein n=1 Tax=Capitella teleta TaxID=283909 RepID=R7U6A8_CAPTE|nr:hypothetical protein CAPTEDRAFT_19001 [Capitella teleta]|eukprot:ELU01651.1 hypothetical protein CAPTEDRAFT_19001 [Capitella teleta]